MPTPFNAPILEGHSAMVAWDESWRSGDMPIWFKRALRARFRKIAGLRAGPCYTSVQLGDSQLWTHWGSVRRASCRAVITQPYADHGEEAEQWAADLGCRLVDAKQGGPWHPKTWLYEFQPFPSDMSTGDVQAPKYPFATLAVGESFPVTAGEVQRTRNAARSFTQKQRASNRPVWRFTQRTDPVTRITHFTRSQ